MAQQRIQRALISVFDKRGVVDLARALVEHDVVLLSTGGTHRLLAEAGLPVIEVASATGFPEMMDGRVKTLHPVIHGGLLLRRDRADHAAQAREHGIDPIDLVVVNLYPFEATADRADATSQEQVEQIDIGGPSMLRSAAKNHAAVTVLTSPADYEPFLAELATNDGATSAAFRAACARRVFRLTSRYDALIADQLTRMAAAEDPAIGDDERFPDAWALPLHKVQDLRYGENPHQRAAFYGLRLPGLRTLATARQLHGKALSYNNLMDCDGAWELVKEFAPPACAIIKHANPCGCAIAENQEHAFRRAWEGDPQAAFGSIIAVNRPLEAATAAALAEPGRFVEVILAPGFTDEAVEILTTRPKWRANVRLVDVGGIDPVPAEALAVKQVLGGLLVQEVDRRGWESEHLQVATRRSPDEREMADLALAWPIVKHLKSNAICLVRDGQLVGAGAGQMSRVNASWIAAHFAGERARGAVLASDAFFPFPDGVEEAARAGITAIVQPGGSKGDAAVIAAADEAGMAMVLTGVRHFRH